jgi:hypothetical protein
MISDEISVFWLSRLSSTRRRIGFERMCDRTIVWISAAISWRACVLNGRKPR